MIKRSDISGFTAHRIREARAALVRTARIGQPSRGYVADVAECFAVSLLVSAFQQGVIHGSCQQDDSCTELMAEVCAPLFRANFTRISTKPRPYAVRQQMPHLARGLSNG